MLNVEIVQAIENDLPAILALYAQPEMDNGKILSRDEAQRIFKKMQSYPFYHVFVALIENNIIGTFALLIMDNLAHCGIPSGIIEDVVVAVDSQGKGVGKAMLHFAMNLCKEAGCYKLVLSSNIKRTKAHEFYEKLGFKQHGISFGVNLQ